MSLEKFINEIIPLSKESFEKIEDSFEKIDLPKGHKLIEQGQVCKYLYFIEKGLGRSYFINEKGKNITAWFFAENDVMTVVESFFQQKPSLYEIELLEDTSLYRISFKELQKLFDKYHLAERFGRLLLIKLLIDVAHKLNALQFQTAKERYQFLIDKYPNIAYRAPLGHIASYLGITQETLSRIRAQK
jgi:CRP-like cAMP-binding protein